MHAKPIIIYTTARCGDCRAVKLALERRGLPFVEVDIERDASARAQVEELNGGRRSVPTLVHGGSTANLSRFSLAKLRTFLSGAGLS